MDLQVLVSTMYQNNRDLAKKMNLQSDAVIINQCHIDSTESLDLGPYSIKWINSRTRGLSISRNMALSYADSEVCLLADDDLVYINNYKDIVINQFNKNPSIDIIAFQVEGIEQEFKKYSTREKRIGLINSMKVSSVQIGFRINRIRENNIGFNELFGAGAEYSMGEENIFLADCLRHNLKIKYVPIKIANLHIGESSWFKGFNKKYFVDKGACFEAMSNLLSLPMIAQFALRKYPIYKSSSTMMGATKLMLEGRTLFRKRNKDNSY